MSGETSNNIVATRAAPEHTVCEWFLAIVAEHESYGLAVEEDCCVGADLVRRERSWLYLQRHPSHSQRITMSGLAEYRGT